MRIRCGRVFFAFARILLLLSLVGGAGCVTGDFSHAARTATRTAPAARNTLRLALDESSALPGAVTGTWEARGKWWAPGRGATGREPVQLTLVRTSPGASASRSATTHGLRFTRAEGDPAAWALQRPAGTITMAASTNEASRGVVPIA